jgi:small neutral amino acid transporter SnatA (MarC family)
MNAGRSLPKDSPPNMPGKRRVRRAANPIGRDSPTNATDAKRWALAAVSLAIPAGAGEAAEATVAVTSSSVSFAVGLGA